MLFVRIFTSKRSIVLLTSLMLIAALATAEDHISPEAFITMKHSERLLIDVRTLAEYSEGHIPTSVNMPLNDIPKSVERLSDFKNFPIVVYCHSGQLANEAIAMLQDNGFTNVKHLQGDMLDWQKDQRAVNSLN